MARKCKRKKANWQGVTIALPCGASKLTDAHKRVIDDKVTAGEWSSAKGKKCRGVFFNATSFALRCDRNRAKVAGKTYSRVTGRRKKLASIRKSKKARIVKKGGSERAAETRYRSMRRRGEICRKGSKKSGKFASTGCRKGA